MSIGPNGKLSSWHGGEDVWKLVDEIAVSLNKAANVALGFECPLWVPIRHQPEELTSARCGDGNRAWSAVAGATSLAVGLAQCAWILQEIRNKAQDVEAFLKWDSDHQFKSGLFIWEAFVSGGAKSNLHKSNSHIEDAMTAVCAFIRSLPFPQESNAVHPSPQTRSLIGTALLWAGWSEDINLLHQPCIVIKACE